MRDFAGGIESEREREVGRERERERQRERKWGRRECRGGFIIIFTAAKP